MFYSPRSITARSLLLPTYVLVAILLYYVTVKKGTSPSFSQINNSVHRYQASKSIHHQRMAASQRLEASTKTTTCSLDDLSSGRWIPRSPKFLSVDAFLTGSEDAGMLECEGEDDRKIEIVNWVFSSQVTSCARVEWNRKEVVRWLLSSPEGLIVVGDSLGEQFSAAFRSLLSINLLVEGRQIKGATLPNGKPMNLEKALYLRRAHPFYSEFQNSGEFSSTRLTKPLVHFFRSHHLLSDQDIAQVFIPTSDSGEEEAKRPGVKRSGYPWGSDPDYLAFISATLVSYLSLSPGPHVGSREYTNPTTLIINTGPHWHTSHFSNLDSQIPGNITMLAAYERMANLVISRLPISPLLHTIIRNNNPVSFTCSSKVSPPDLTSTREITSINTGQRYNYDLFPHFDQLWRDAISRRHQQISIDSSGGTLELWDNWGMMSKRMEAKKGPKVGDCLHYCVPALYESARILMQYLMF